MKRQRWKDVAAFLVILFLLPYVFTLLAAGAGEGRKESGKSGVQVTVAGEGYEENISLTEYLTGALAAQMPAGYEPEALKAQAVLVRTYYELHEKEQKVIGEEDSQPYLSGRQLKELWGEAYDENYRRLEQAVTDSGYECIFYGDKMAEPFYHAVSAGRTRSGAEVFHDDSYAYLASVECPSDITAENYVTIRKFTIEEVYALMKQDGGLPEDVTEQAAETVWNEVTRDGAGYIVTWKPAGQTIHGEKLRTLLGLPSACFEAEPWDEGIRFVCRGRGHGLGMSLYEANQLAVEGKDYKQILKYFFKDITISPPQDE